MRHSLRSLIHLPPPLLLLCAGVLSAVLISAAVSRQLISDRLDAAGNEYGKALANLAARQATDATLNHDLISLQVILSDVAENAKVINATIHDVENNLLVQAESARDLGLHGRRFTAPIALHDSIAGYVTVTLDLGETVLLQRELLWLFSLTAILIVALTTAAYYYGRNSDDGHGAVTAAAGNRRAIPIVDTPEIDLRPAKSEQDLYSVELLLHFHNLQSLNLQLNRERFNALLRRMEKQLQGILTLYNGELVNMEMRQAVVRFDGPISAGETLFQAVCSAHLFLALNSAERDLPLQVSGVIGPCVVGLRKIRSIAQRLRQQAAMDSLLNDGSTGRLYIDSELLDDYSLAEKFECENSAPQASSTSIYTRVEQVFEPYRSLLAKQLQRLQDNEAVV